MKTLPHPLFAALLAAFAPALAHGGAPSDGHDEHAVAVVAAATEAEFDAASFDAALDALGGRSVGTLFEILAAGGVPAAWLPNAQRFLPLGEEWLHALHGALARLPLATLRTFLTELSETETRMRFRDTGVSLLGEAGTYRDVRLILALASPLQEGSDVLPRSTRKALEKALYQLLERDEGGFHPVADAFPQTHVGLRSAIVDAVERFSTELALETLADFLGQTPGLDAHVLTAIARIASDVPQPVDARIAADVRAFVSDSDVSVSRSAIRACGLLRDYDALPGLLDMLEGEDAGLRNSAHRALHDLTGLAFRPDIRLWRGWYERERVWWRDHQPTLARDLDSGDESAALRAIMSMARQHLWPHRLAPVLEVALDRREPTVVRHACHALGEIRSMTAVPRLIDSLEHREGEVRIAAWEALQAITGRSLPSDPAIWRASLRVDDA